jgi:hypothetical protein
MSKLTPAQEKALHAEENKLEKNKLDKLTDVLYRLAP